VQLADGAHPTTTVGLGTLAGGEALLRRWAARIAPHRLADPELAAPASALLYCAESLGHSASKDEDIQPLRYGSWLFSAEGELETFPRVQAWIESELPPHLLRAVGSRTVATSAFALFLASLRNTDPDRPLSPHDGARRLAQVGRVLAVRAASEGAARAARLLLVATDGRVLLAARVGDVPTQVALLEGTASCVRCGIQGGSKMDVQVRGHLRARAVAVTSFPLTPGTHWLGLLDGGALGVGPTLEVEMV
jgi:hypothetical protein